MQDHPSSSTLPSNTHDSETWKAYWKEQGQPWRAAPAIDEERQQRLLSYYQGGVDIERGIYPFKGVRLSRADVEWLLAMEEQRGAELSPRDGKGGNQHKSFGLDLRGVDLSQVNLSDLPLMRLHAGLSLEEGRHATVEQSRAAAANLARADLGKASLKQAILAGTHLEGVDLTKAHLEGSTLLEAYLEGAMLQGAYLEEANLFVAHLEGARLAGAHLEGTSLLDTHFEGKAFGGDELKHLRAWMPHFPEVLPAADLRGVYLNSRTQLDEIHVGDDQYGYIALADVHWGDVNLTVVDWADLKRLGDETIARPLKVEEEEEGAQPGERGLPPRAERAVDMLLRAQEVSDAVVSYVTRSPSLANKVRERIAREERTQRETQQQLELERFRVTVRANRQLAVVLRAQGLNEAADRFAYRAQVLQRRVLWRSGARSYGSYFFSCFLDVLAGYGYTPGRTVTPYISTNLRFAIIYFSLGLLAGYRASISPLYALIISIISFHGRGFFPSGFLPTFPMAVFAACEAIIGLTIEISFIATFTQRYFGK